MLSGNELLRQRMILSISLIATTIFLVYSKSLSSFQIGKMSRSEDSISRYKNSDNDPRGNWTSGDLSVKTYSEKK